MKNLTDIHSGTYPGLKKDGSKNDQPTQLLISPLSTFFRVSEFHLRSVRGESSKRPYAKECCIQESCPKKVSGTGWPSSQVSGGYQVQ